MECSDRYLPMLARACAHVHSRIPFHGCDRLHIWIEHFADGEGGYSEGHVVLNPSRISPALLGHEYGHFLDSVLGLRQEWMSAVHGTPDFEAWSKMDDAAYLTHPGEMVARYVEQFVCPSVNFHGRYASKTFVALKPTFIRLVTR